MEFMEQNVELADRFPSDLDDTSALLQERESSWGNASLTHARIAQVWSGILDVEVTAHQAALCMAGLKLVRADLSPDDPDSLDDAAAYVRIAQQIIGGRA